MTPIPRPIPSRPRTTLTLFGSSACVIEPLCETSSSDGGPLTVARLTEAIDFVCVGLSDRETLAADGGVRNKIEDGDGFVR